MSAGDPRTMGLCGYLTLSAICIPCDVGRVLSGTMSVVSAIEANKNKSKKEKGIRWAKGEIS
jgi:hypothetical protein